LGQLSLARNHYLQSPILLSAITQSIRNQQLFQNASNLPSHLGRGLLFALQSIDWVIALFVPTDAAGQTEDRAPQSREHQPLHIPAKLVAL
jgi:hypothetical protein